MITKSIESTKPKKNQKTVDITEESLNLLVQAKEEHSISYKDFVRRCILAHGPIILGKTNTTKDDGELEARLKYLEAITTNLAYTPLVNKLREEGTLEAHQELLREVAPQHWRKTKRLRSKAKENDETRHTTLIEWQTLVRKLDDFLEE